MRTRNFLLPCATALSLTGIALAGTGCRGRTPAVAPLAAVPASIPAKPLLLAPPRPKDWTVPGQFRGVIVRNQGRGFKKRLIALTFDDGPTGEITPQVLKTLHDLKVKATFFVMGQQAQLYPKLIEREVAEGHALGIHSYTHSRSPAMRVACMEMDRCESVLKKITGRKTQLFRPPYGKLTSTHAKTGLARRYAVTLWTNSAGDTSTRKVQSVFHNVVANAQDGDIVLMHDAYGKQHTASALPLVIKALRKKGFSFVTVPEMLTQWAAWEQAHHASKATTAKKTGPPPISM